VVVCTEALKILVSFGAIGVEKRGIAAGFSYLLEEMSSKPILWRILLIPAILYTVQNNIVLLAIEYLDTGTYSILRQLKIPITAILWVLFMKARLSRTKWISLVVLMVGVMMVQTSSYENSVHISNTYSILTGLFCVIASCLTSGESLVCLVFFFILACSPVALNTVSMLKLLPRSLLGFAAVYFEKIIKSSEHASNLWTINFMLASISTVLAILACLSNQWTEVLELGFFHGYDWIVILLVVLGACDGLVVALVVKYTDNIAKSFAASLAIVVTCLAALYSGDFVLTQQFFFGGFAVVGASFIYAIG
jgi:UDP-sugar transporter A1/2/3